MGFKLVSVTEQSGLEMMGKAMDEFLPKLSKFRNAVKEHDLEARLKNGQLRARDFDEMVDLSECIDRTVWACRKALNQLAEAAKKGATPGYVAWYVGIVVKAQDEAIDLGIRVLEFLRTESYKNDVWLREVTGRV